MATIKMTVPDNGKGKTEILIVDSKHYSDNQLNRIHTFMATCYDTDFKAVTISVTDNEAPPQVPAKN